MTKRYVIRDGFAPNQPTLLAPLGSVGIFRADEAYRFDAIGDAEAFMVCAKLHGMLPSPKLYQWCVASDVCCQLPRPWSPRPGDRGFDLMH